MNKNSYHLVKFQLLKGEQLIVHLFPLGILEKWQSLKLVFYRQISLFQLFGWIFLLNICIDFFLFSSFTVTNTIATLAQSWTRLWSDKDEKRSESFWRCSRTAYYSQLIHSIWGNDTSMWSYTADEFPVLYVMPKQSSAGWLSLWRGIILSAHSRYNLTEHLSSKLTKQIQSLVFLFDSKSRFICFELRESEDILVIMNGFNVFMFFLTWIIFEARLI